MLDRHAEVPELLGDPEVSSRLLADDAGQADELDEELGAALLRDGIGHGPRNGLAHAETSSSVPRACEPA